MVPDLVNGLAQLSAVMAGPIAAGTKNYITKALRELVDRALKLGRICYL